MNGMLRFIAMALLGGVSLPLFLPSSAYAVLVTVNGVSYDVNVSSMAYTIDSSRFQQPPLGQMPWWGDDIEASEFATEVFDQLGPGWDADYGPVFAYSMDGPFSQVLGLTQSLSDLNDQIDVTPATNAMVSYAIARTPVPLPLPLLGAAAGLGWTRQLRRRVKQANRLPRPMTSPSRT